MNIPKQLQNSNFRFYRVVSNQKFPKDKQWPDSVYTHNCFEIQQHLKEGGNVGIVTGKGNLVVIDFDDKDFMDLLKDRLPWTFIVKTASKQLWHMYYILKGDMFKKVGIDIGDKRVCDIQAARCGIICPPSRIGDRHYEVVNDIHIATITIDDLKNVFGDMLKQSSFSNYVEYDNNFEDNPDAVNEAITVLKRLGVHRMKPRHYTCPFHSSSSRTNLYLGNSGELHCFNCRRHWKHVSRFEEDYRRIKK